MERSNNKSNCLDDLHNFWNNHFIKFMREEILVSRLKAIAISFVDGMWFASYTVLPTIGVMWAMGIVSFNI